MRSVRMTLKYTTIYRRQAIQLLHSGVLLIDNTLLPNWFSSQIHEGCISRLKIYSEIAEARSPLQRAIRHSRLPFYYVFFKEQGKASRSLQFPGLILPPQNLPGFGISLLALNWFHSCLTPDT